MTVWLEDNYCYYAWKPHGIASTWGQGPCFLDLFDSPDDTRTQQIAKKLQSHFTKEEEYGLLNRLDNDTAGLLYFAKDPTIKEEWKQLQKEGKIVKYYLADIRGEVIRKRKCIAYPILHHPQSSDRMMCMMENGDNYPKAQYCETWVENLYYDKERNISRLLIMLYKGVRHQIRCHLASIGCPIVGEKLYKKKKDTGLLHLRSIGVHIDG